MTQPPATDSRGEPPAEICPLCDQPLTRGMCSTGCDDAESLPYLAPTPPDEPIGAKPRAVLGQPSAVVCSVADDRPRPGLGIVVARNEPGWLVAWDVGTQSYHRPRSLVPASRAQLAWRAEYLGAADDEAVSFDGSGAETSYRERAATTITKRPPSPDVVPGPVVPRLPDPAAFRLGPLDGACGYLARTERRPALVREVIDVATDEALASVARSIGLEPAAARASGTVEVYEWGPLRRFERCVMVAGEVRWRCWIDLHPESGRVSLWEERTTPRR